MAPSTPLAPPAPLVCVQVALRAGATATSSARAQVAALPHVVRAISDCLDYQFWTLPRACEANLLSLLPRLLAWGAADGVDPHYWRFQCGRGLVWAIKHDNLAMVEWLHECCPTILPYAAMIEAARLGNLSMLQWLTQRHENPPLLPEVVEAAASTGHTETVQWLLDQGYEFTKLAMEEAMRGGHYEILVLLDEKVLDNISDDCISFDGEPFASGDTRIPQLLLERDDDLYWVRLESGFMRALENGDIAMAEWCRARVGSSFTPGYCYGLKAMDFAAKSGELRVVEWCHEQFPEDCTASAMDRAAADGHLDIVQWLHKNRREGCTTAAMDGAAARGRLDIFQWLEANRTEGCTSLAMDGAARHGHLEVVQWLHEHRTEGCTTRAMDGAASNGHLEVVQWLHEHRAEGCTSDAMDGAAGEGHLDVVKWLHAHRTEGCTTQAMDGAAEGGHLDVVKWLHSNRTEGSTSDAMRSAAHNGHMGVVLYLHSIGSAEYDQCITVAGNMCIEHLEIVQFLHATYPSLTQSCHHSAWGHRAEILSKHVGWSRW